MAADGAASHTDWGALHSDVLRMIYNYLLDAEQPASEAYRAWCAVRLACRHWAEALEQTPPALCLAVSALPEPLLHRWLMAVPVKLLRLSAEADLAWRGLAEPRLTAEQLLSGLEGFGFQPHWSLAALPQLQSLTLEAPLDGDPGPALFDCAALAGLSQLTQLSLLSPSFADFDLQQLPRSVRVLKLAYHAPAALSVPRLPDDVRLDELHVHKQEGAVGLSMGSLYSTVARLEVQAQQLLLGIPVADEQLVHTFERPFREGHFIPPHIWADEQADDESRRAAGMTANKFLLEQAAGGRLLEEMRFAGLCSNSIKFQPVSPGAKAYEQLAWLWSHIYQQGLTFLFGLGLDELEERRQLLGLSVGAAPDEAAHA